MFLAIDVWGKWGRHDACEYCLAQALLVMLGLLTRWVSPIILRKHHPGVISISVSPITTPPSPHKYCLSTVHQGVQDREQHQPSRLPATVGLSARHLCETNSFAQRRGLPKPILSLTDISLPCLSRQPPSWHKLGSSFLSTNEFTLGFSYIHALGQNELYPSLTCSCVFIGPCITN